MCAFSAVHVLLLYDALCSIDSCALCCCARDTATFQSCCCCCCRQLPQPGEGPAREVMLGGYWKHSMIALTQEEPGQQPQVNLWRGLFCFVQ
jgi:hypothetical protein